MSASNLHIEKMTMRKTNVIESPTPTGSQGISKLLDQYGRGPMHFTGTDNGLYERHLLFDNVIDSAAADARDRFEAFARSVRDVLSQRWTLTEDTYEYGIFKQLIQDGWQREQPDNWLRRQDPWEVARPHEKVEVKLNCSFEVSGGALQAIPGRPSTLIGIPFDRPVVGYGGKTINTLRLWAASAPDFFDFQAFSHGDFVGAVAETLEAESLTRVLYPDDSTSMGQGLRFVQ